MRKRMSIWRPRTRRGARWAWGRWRGTPAWRRTRARTRRARRGAACRCSTRGGSTGRICTGAAARAPPRATRWPRGWARSSTTTTRPTAAPRARCAGITRRWCGGTPPTSGVLQSRARTAALTSFAVTILLATSSDRSPTNLHQLSYKLIVWL
jgi:hypothetical protein